MLGPGPVGFPLPAVLGLNLDSPYSVLHLNLGFTVARAYTEKNHRLHSLYGTLVVSTLH